MKLNYTVAITDENSLIYTNTNEDTQEISHELKNFLNEVYKKNDIMEYFNDKKNCEKDNLETSKSMMNEKNTYDNYSKDFEYIMNNLLFTNDKNIKILKYDNFKNYDLKCIIPIKNTFFKGSLIVLINEPYPTKGIKESFFRFCIGLFFIITYYINNADYSQNS